MGAPALVIRVAATLDELKKNLAEGRQEIEVTQGALVKMASSYDGSKIIQQAGATAAAIQQVGGVTTLTAAEQAKANTILEAALAKYQALGKEAPPGMRELAEATKGATTEQEGMLGTLGELGSALGLAFSVEKIVGFTESAFSAASAIHDLSAGSGVAAEEVQRLAYVGQSFNLDAVTMTHAVEQLSDRLAHGDASATRAVQMLGLSVKDLIAAGPLDAFLDVADAAGRLEDPITRGGAASDLFGGKLAKTLLPALSDLRRLMDDVPREAIISDANIKAAADFDASIAHMTTTMKAFAVEYLLPKGASPWLKSLADTATGAQAAAASLKDVGDSVGQLGDKLPDAISNADALANRLRSLREDALVPLSESDKATILEFQAMGDSAEQLAADVEKPVAAVRLFIAAHKEQEIAAKHAAEVEKEAILGVTKLRDEYYSNLVVHGGTANEAAMAEIKRWSEDLAARMKKAGADTTEFYETLARVSKEKLDAVGIDWSEWSQHSIKALQEQRDNAYDTLIRMEESGQFFRGELEKQRAKYEELKEAAHGFGETAVDATQKATKAVEELTMSMAALEGHLNSNIKNVRTLGGEFITAAEAKKAFDSGGSFDVKTLTAADAASTGGLARLKQIEAYYDIFPGAAPNGNGPTGLAPGDSMGWDRLLQMQQEYLALLKAHNSGIPGFADGVRNFTGGMAIVGERGPEIVNLPRGSDVFPNGQMSGVTVNIVVNGSVLSDQHQLANVVGDAFMARLRAMGMRFPAAGG